MTNHEMLVWMSALKALFQDMDDSLAGADLAGANLDGSNLRKAKLRNAKLTGAKLWNADLAGSDLRGASLWKADLTGADLTDADLTGADLTDAGLRGANLVGAENYAEFYFANMSSRNDSTRVVVHHDGIRIYAGCFQNKTLAEFIEQVNRTKEAGSLYHTIAIPALIAYENWLLEGQS